MVLLLFLDIDVVIGAPYENDFRGAVYVYMGSAKGLETKYTQVRKDQRCAEALSPVGWAFGPFDQLLLP